MRTRIHREKKEYLPELKVGEPYLIILAESPADSFSFMVTKDIKNFYESIAKSTGLSFPEIVDELNYLFEGKSDDEINDMIGIKGAIRPIAVGGIDVDGFKPQDRKLLIERLSELIIKSRCID